MDAFIYQQDNMSSLTISADKIVASVNYMFNCDNFLQSLILIQRPVNFSRHQIYNIFIEFIENNLKRYLQAHRTVLK